MRYYYDTHPFHITIQELNPDGKTWRDINHQQITEEEFLEVIYQVKSRGYQLTLSEDEKSITCTRDDITTHRTIYTKTISEGELLTLYIP